MKLNYLIPKRLTLQIADGNAVQSTHKTAPLRVDVHGSTCVMDSNLRRLGIVIFREIPKFNGDSKADYESWWSQLNHYFQQFNLSEERKLLIAQNSISGMARRLLDSYTNIVDVRDINQILRPIFVPVDRKADELFNLKKQSDESIQMFAARVRMHVMVDVKPEAVEQFALPFFIRGLEADLGRKVRDLRPDTLARAIQLANIIQSEQVVKVPSVTLNTLTSYQMEPPAPKRARSERNSIRCYFCKNLGHGYRKCFKATEKDKQRIEEDQRQRRLQTQGKTTATTNSLNSNLQEQTNHR